MGLRGWDVPEHEMKASYYDRAPVSGQVRRERPAGGPAGRDLGKWNEARLVAVVRSLALPWVLGVRAADAAEDRQGIDVVVETDRGVVHLQSKSSRGEANRWRRRHVGSRIRCIVMVTDRTEVVARALAALTAAYVDLGP